MDNDEDSNGSVTRRASDSSQLMLINNGTQRENRPLSRVPFPLPYLASDYLPSPNSPKHLVISPNQNVFPHSIGSSGHQPGSSGLVKTNARQRSQSVDHSLEQDTRQLQRQRRFLALESSQSHENLDLIPYREWTIISRNDTHGQMVLFNPENCRVIVQRYLPESTSSSPSNVPLSQFQAPSQSRECPLCHRPFSKRATGEPNFMDRNYFRLLASSSPSEQASGQTPLLSSFSSGNIKLNTNAFNEGYYEKFFVELKKLGRGFRGSVFLCEHLLDGVKLGKYAVKKVAIGNNHPWLVKMLREVHLLERLRHPNIINYKHAWLEYNRLTSFGPKVPCLFILMECANGGNLEEYLEPETLPQVAEEVPTERRKSAKEMKRERIKRQLQEQEVYEAEAAARNVQVQKRLLSMAEIWSMFLDIVEGLAHLHLQNIVHRDLKPPNLLLKWDEPSREGMDDWNHAARFGIPRVLISDFGECEDLEGTPDSERTGATGTLEFMAPEHVQLDPRGRNHVEYSSKADMWSLGMVLYYLCYSRLPYENVNDVDTLREEILTFHTVTFPASRFDVYDNTNNIQVDTSHGIAISEDIPQELKILIRMLLSVDPDKRPSCKEILSKLHGRRPDNSTEIPFSGWSHPGFEGSNAEASGMNDDPSDEDILHPVESDSMAATDSDGDIKMADTRKKRSSASVSPLASVTRPKSSLRKRQRLGSSRQNKPNEIDNMLSSTDQSDRENLHALLMDANNQTNPLFAHWLREHVPTEKQYLNALKIATAVLKIASCTYTCSPYAAKPGILYPVIFLATLDFWSMKVSHSLSLVGIHLFWVIAAALMTGGMCVA